MDIPKVEDLLKMSFNKEVLKKTIGDGPEFDLVYQALLDNMKDEAASEGNESNSSQDYLVKSTNAGVRLDKIPMRIKRENENIINNLYNKLDNEVSLQSLDNKVTSQDVDISNLDNGERINRAVDKYSQEFGVDKNLILAIIKQESNFDPNVESEAGAKGLMQLMDFNVEEYGVTDPFNIEENIRGGVNHIKEYLDMFDGNIEMALMAYNGGPGNMERRGVTSVNDIYKMPLETQAYVPKVMNYYRNGF
ncbi:lytic transglycosylase domain-containing protein [Clostridium septicum]|uniref:Lytic transglycosylase domain-containing protein n=2 Tax=Clostridium septicum TaxID=1504 RepID=A0ABY5B393_CLOSE|nr:lytic transglycosylase domain-containing protein [Clostridium septicum]MDU1314342.1 lytic transglycosylase domain-containing protein [Clostridium septicum]UEC20685.1 lytic transglycosylase domain-containing protein [Clostridium septicum]USS01264.1 lytic transglycosylase domain-containing protein [Clostridium septicum]